MVDMSRKEARAMLNMPAEMTSMVPEVAADFVAMMGSVVTVVNDSEVKSKTGQRLFRYPSAGAIFDTARKHMNAHGFFPIFPGGYEWNKTHSVVSMNLSFVHKSGTVIPMARSIMPCLGFDTKAVCCTVTELRKYMIGVALFMSWNDQREDAVQVANGQGNGHVPPKTQHSPQPMETERKVYPADEPKRETAIVMPYRGWLKGEYDELKANTKLALQSMKQKGFSPIETYYIATGRNLTVLPPLPFPSACDAIILCALICARHSEDKLKGLDNKRLHLIAQDGDELPFINGKITDFGTARDKYFQSHEPKKKAEPEDKREPPPGWDKTPPGPRPGSDFPRCASEIDRKNRGQPMVLPPDPGPPAEDDIPF
jgi:hypothetical protein